MFILFSNLYIQLKVIKFYLFAIIGCNRDTVSKDLSADIILETLYSSIALFVFRQSDIDAVGYFKAVLLTQVLDTVDQLTSHTFTTEFISQFNFEGNGKRTFISNQPSWNILADDLYILDINYNIFSINNNCVFCFLLEFQNLFLIQCHDSIVDTLHQFSEFLSECSEVTFYLFYQNAIAFNEFQFFDIHFVHNQFLDSFDMAFLFIIYSWYHDTLQRLTNFDIDFTT